MLARGPAEDTQGSIKQCNMQQLKLLLYQPTILTQLCAPLVFCSVPLILLQCLNPRPEAVLILSLWHKSCGIDSGCQFVWWNSTAWCHRSHASVISCFEPDCSFAKEWTGLKPVEFECRRMILFVWLVVFASSNDLDHLAGCYFN